MMIQTTASLPTIEQIGDHFNVDPYPILNAIRSSKRADRLRRWEKVPDLALMIALLRPYA